MDELGLITLLAEMREDVRIAQRAYRLARDRFESPAESSLEGCEFHLLRLFNIIEQMALRVARAFENHVDDNQGWHAELIRRLSIEVPGIRPALFPEHARNSLHDLRGLRHVLTHAYDLELDARRLALVLEHALEVHDGLPQWVDAFATQVAAAEGWHLPKQN